MPLSKTKEYEMDETLNRIVNNEVRKHINRFPTAQEFKSLIEYITYWMDDDTDVQELEEQIKQWTLDYMAACEDCGEWHLKEEMEQIHGDYYCDDQCYELHMEHFVDYAGEEARNEYGCMDR